jgi:hypothetical protein
VPDRAPWLPPFAGVARADEGTEDTALAGISPVRSTRKGAGDDLADGSRSSGMSESIVVLEAGDGKPSKRTMGIESRSDPLGAALGEARSLM